MGNPLPKTEEPSLVMSMLVVKVGDTLQAIEEVEADWKKTSKTCE